jgi:hypothetical protein
VEASARDAANKMLNIQRNWGAKMSTPGASLSVKETSRGEVQGQRFVGFHVFETGLPKDLSYKVQEFPIDMQLRDLMDGVSFDDKGMAICAGTPGMCQGDKPNDDIEFKLVALAGEPIRIALVSDDGDHRAFTSIIPFPIEARDKGCTLQAIRLMPDNELVLLQGDHFPPNSDLQMESSSEGESHNGTQKSDADGHVEFAFMPGVKGKERGTTKVSLRSQTCDPSLKFYWGKGTSELR